MDELKDPIAKFLLRFLFGEKLGIILAYPTL